MNTPKADNDSARFMMYFKPATLNELRVLSRMLDIAMVDFVDAAMKAYIFAREQELGSSVPPRKTKRYVGPRMDTSEKRIRYVMRLKKPVVETMRDIAYLDSRRFTQVCDEALSDFISFTKEVKNFKNVWISRSDVEAVRGRKSAASSEVINALLEQYKTAEKLGRDPGRSKTTRDVKRTGRRYASARKSYNS